MAKKNSTPNLNLRDEANFFVCDVLVPKDDMASMEHPIFSLSTKADTKIRYYEHNGNSIKITPSVVGLATIHDKDILIYSISQIVAKMKEGHEASRTVRMKARDLLLSTGRGAGGRDYKLLKEAFERLRGTSITTDIKTNGQTISKGFGLIDQWEIVTEDKKNAKMLEIEVTISEWMYNSILGKEILTISKDYFNRPLSD
jgi:plasmid replication initiation protein